MIAVANFDAKKDCEVLMKAMKGLGTNEDALTSVLCARSWKQREELETTYEEVYKKVCPFLIHASIDF